MQTSKILKSSLLFKGIQEENISLVLECLGAVECNYKKSNCIVDIGDLVQEVGVIVRGSTNAVTETSKGVRSIISKLSPGDVFGDAIVCSGIQRSPIRLVASSDCQIIKIGMHNIINPNLRECEFRNIIIENLLYMTSSSYVSLNKKLDILSYKSVRDRIMLYLSDEMERCFCCEFCIPFNRNEMAEYLQVERSALSRELGRLKTDGYIDYERSTFKILKLSEFKSL